MIAFGCFMTVGKGGSDPVLGSRDRWISDPLQVGNGKHNTSIRRSSPHKNPSDLDRVASRTSDFFPWKLFFASNFGVPPKILPDLRTRYFLELILGGMTSTKWPELEVRLGWFFFQTKKNNYPSWELTYPLKKAHVKMIFLGYPPCQSFKTITGFPLPPLPKKNCANHFSSTPPPTPTPSPQIT